MIMDRFILKNNDINWYCMKSKIPTNERMDIGISVYSSKNNGPSIVELQRIWIDENSFIQNIK